VQHGQVAQRNVVRELEVLERPKSIAETRSRRHRIPPGTNLIIVASAVIRRTIVLVTLVERTRQSDNSA
jgi:hypothetical protein